MKQLFESTAPWPERRPYGSTLLASLPFQLLPNVVRQADELDRVLSWQQSFSEQSQILPAISVVAVLSANTPYSYLLESLNAQSYRADEVIVVTPPNATLKLNKEIPHSVVELEPGEPIGRSLRAILGSLNKPSSFTDPRKRAVIVLGDLLLHPEALFILAKELITSSFVYSNALRIENSKNLAYCRTADYFIRRSKPDLFSVLGRNPFGRLLGFETKLLADLASDQLLDETESEGAFWRIAAVANLKASKATLTPLALGIELGALPIDHSIAAVVRACAKDREISLTTTKTFSLPIEHGVVPEASDSEGEIQVVIPYRNQADLTIKALHSLAEQSIASDLSVTLVNNNSSPEEQNKIEAALNSLPQLRASVVNDGGYFNFARLNNRGSASAKTPFILFLNNDVQLSSKETLRHLRSWCALKDVGCVGGLLRYENGTTQHAGISFLSVRPGNMSLPEHYSEAFREVDGITFAMAMVKRAAYHLIAGLDEVLCPNGFGDALFCYHLRKRGYRILFTPLAEGTHFESVSRGSTPEELELWEMQRSGLEIADLYDDFGANNQPTIVRLGAEGSQFEALVEKIRYSPRKLKVANSVSAVALKGWRTLKRLRP